MSTSGAPHVAFCKHDDRSIVDPKQWETTEVGGAEGLAFMHNNAVKKSKVSSMRSSLFQKNVKKASQNGCNNHSFYPTLLFVAPADADTLRAVQFAHDAPGAALDYCDYGKANRKTWTKDVFAFFHNAVRCELRGLVAMLRSLHAIGPKLNIGHFASMRLWWHTCSSLLLDYLDMEVKYLEPWIAIALNDGNDANTKQAMKLFQAMPQRQEAVRKMFINISRSFGDLCDPPSIQKDALNHMMGNNSPSVKKTMTQKALVIIGNLDACVVDVGTYLTEQETVFSPVLHDAYKSEKKDREVLMNRGVKHFVKKGRKSDFMLVLLTRWMDDTKMVKTHIKMIQELHECTYGTLICQFENHHGNLVEQLKDDAGR